ncbi:MAG: FlgD immunoglobulin-like domain containing protein, partial [Candidatus Cloacimonadota bacterium]|nr:FlgD immunoglobulin-like domain containing protein [Candidatus Cloacimonadota bacterium]
NIPHYRYFNSNENNPTVHKMEPAFYGIGDVASNEDYICYMTNPEIGLNYLRLYSCNEEDIILENEIQMSSYCYYVYLENNYLFMRNSSDDLEVYEILPDYTIEYVQDINNLGEDPSLLQKPDETFSNNIFVFYEQGGLKYTSVRQNTPPFSEIANFKLNIGENIYSKMYILEQDKLLLAKYNSFLPNEYCLCQYTYPDTLESLDELTSDNKIKPTGNILLGKDNYETEVDFYTWQNDSIELIGDYDFGIEVTDNIMLPDRNKLYVVGRYQLDEYDITLTANQSNELPSSDLTLQNHPNPFNPSTTISFMLPEPASQIKVNIYNLKGQKIRTLSRNSLRQGEHNLVWNGTDDENNSVASGVYLYRLQADGQTKATSKCLLLK